MKLSDLYRRNQVYNFRGEPTRPQSDVALNKWDLMGYAQHDITEPQVETEKISTDPYHQSGGLDKEDYFETDGDDSILATQRDAVKMPAKEENPIANLTTNSLGGGEIPADSRNPRSPSLPYRSGNQYTPPSRPRHRKFMGFPKSMY